MPGATPQSMTTHAALARQGVQVEQVLRHERDVGERLAGLDHGAHGLLADPAGAACDEVELLGAGSEQRSACGSRGPAPESSAAASGRGTAGSAARSSAMIAPCSAGCENVLGLVHGTFGGRVGRRNPCVPGVPSTRPKQLKIAAGSAEHRGTAEATRPMLGCARRVRRHSVRCVASSAAGRPSRPYARTSRPSASPSGSR